ncbi:MAG: hypothetical protein AAGK14_10095 [Verrucomicrobiota bacterium]
MADPSRQLGLLLAVAPGHPNFARAVAAIDYALERGTRVFVYAIDEGVRAVPGEELQQRRETHPDTFALWACAYGAEKRGLPTDDRAAYAGLSVLADLIASTDKFVCVSQVAAPGGTRPGRRAQPPRTLVLVEADPESDPRAAEGVRIAAGVGAWELTEVTLGLRGPATDLLTGENPDDWVDGRDLANQLEAVRERPTPLTVVAFPEERAELEPRLRETPRLEWQTPDRATEWVGGFDAVIAL